MPYDNETSRPAYNEAKQTSDKKRQIVFSTIRKLQPCNDREIADYLGWGINCVTPRRNELAATKDELGRQIEPLIYSVCKKKDPTTNRTVNYWAVKPVFSQSEIFKK